MKERTVILEQSGAPEFGILRSRSWFPVPDFGALCVCCDAPGDAPIEFDPSARDQRAGKVTVPLCHACADHIGRSKLLTNLLTTLMGIGLFLAIMGPFTAWGMSIAGALLFLLGLGVYQGLKQSKLRRARDGHHRGLDLWVGEGYAGISTTNERVVRELLERHPNARKA